MFLAQLNMLQEEFFHNMAMLRQQTIRLELEIQRYLGEDTRGLQYEDLTKLEQELENSVARIRNRQVHALINRYYFPNFLCYTRLVFFNFLVYIIFNTSV